MSKTDDFNYDEPWSMFEDEEEPWKDLDRLLDWEERLDTQMELGDAFGCSPSTISYWLNKARDEVEPEYDDEELQCDHFEECGNLVPGPNNGTCIVCLDLMRHNDREAGLDPSDSESMTAHVGKLYEEYPDYAEQQQAVYDEKHADDDDEDDEDSETES